MERTLDLKKHHCVLRLGVFLITGTLIVAMVGCRDNPAPSYVLTVTATDGGSITEPGEGDFAYDTSMLLNLVAIPDDGYVFIDWSGDVSTIADVGAAETTVTMEGNYDITANFGKRLVEPPDWNTPGVYYRRVTYYHRGPSRLLEGGYRIGNRANGDYEFTDWHWFPDLIGLEEFEVTLEIEVGPGLEPEIGPEGGNCYASGANALKIEYYVMGGNRATTEAETYFNTGWQLAVYSTRGGSVATPGEEDSPFYYKYDQEVDLVAVPDPGYEFVSWAGDVATVGDVSAAETTITMDDSYSVTANFRTPANWAIIGGVIAAAVAMGLALFFLRSRRTSAA